MRARPGGGVQIQLYEFVLNFALLLILFRLEPELDKELNARKEEKRQLIAKSEEATQQHLHFAELQALSQKAEDLLIKPTYMPPKPNLGVPQNPFAKRDSNGERKTFYAIVPISIESRCIESHRHPIALHRIAGC